MKIRHIVMLMLTLGALALSAAEPPPSLAGFRIGQRFDFTNETVCAANKMTGWPVKDLEKFGGFTCYSTEPRDGFDIVHILVTKKMRVIEVYAACECKDESAAKEKHAELKKWIVKTYGDRIEDGGPYNLELCVADEYAIVTLKESDLRHAYSADPD